MIDKLKFRWLGSAGIEMESRGERLLVDPYLTRVPFRFLLIGKQQTNRPLVLRHLAPARCVLITHPHFDHLMDTPIVCQELGAKAYGSANMCAILRVHSVPPDRMREVHAGDSFVEGPFAIQVFSGKHNRVFGRLPHAGPLPEELKLPLRLSDYRMDCEYSFLVSVAGTTFLFWNRSDPLDAPKADVLVATLAKSDSEWKRIIQAVQPKVVIPIHWDNFFSPLDRPLRPMLASPRLDRRPFRRMDPEEFARGITSAYPTIRVVIPKVFNWMDLAESWGRVNS